MKVEYTNGMDVHSVNIKRNLVSRNTNIDQILLSPPPKAKKWLIKIKGVRFDLHFLISSVSDVPVQLVMIHIQNQWGITCEHWGCMFN